MTHPYDQVKVRPVDLAAMQPIQAASFAARICKGKEHASCTEERDEALVRGCLKAGHLEVFQHLPVRVKIRDAPNMRLLLATRRSIGALTVEPHDGWWPTNAAVLWESQEYLSYRPEGRLKSLDLVDGVLHQSRYGHTTIPIDHPMRLHSFVVDCSRVVSHQLVRSKVLSSYCQLSQRAVAPHDVMLTGDPHVDLLSTIALDHMGACDAEKELKRYAAPEGSMTRILVTKPTYMWRDWIGKRGHHKTGKAQAEHEVVALAIERDLRAIGAL